MWVVECNNELSKPYFYLSAAIAHALLQANRGRESTIFRFENGILRNVYNVDKYAITDKQCQAMFDLSDFAGEFTLEMGLWDAKTSDFHLEKSLVGKGLKVMGIGLNYCQKPCKGKLLRMCRVLYGTQEVWRGSRYWGV